MKTNRLSKHEMIDWIKKLNKREKIDAKSSKRALLYHLKAVLAPFAVRIDSNKCKDNENSNDNVNDDLSVVKGL